MRRFTNDKITLARWIAEGTLFRVCCAAAAAAIVFSAGALSADELNGQAWWPCFHGPRRDNISHETGLLRQWPDGGPKLIWKNAQCGNGFSGVSIADNKIFTAGDFDTVEKVLALDLDGHLLWQSPNGESWPGPYPGSRTTPAYNEGAVYQMGPKGRLAGFDAKTGRPKWSIDLVAKFGARYGTWSMTENVVVDGDRVFCVPGGSKALVVALNKRTGDAEWINSALDETAAYCSPILVRHGGVRQLITLTQKSVIGVDLNTGKLLWQHAHVTRHDQNVNAPLYHDGYVFVASGHSGGGRLLRIAEDSSKAEQVWWDKALDNCHGSAILRDGCLYGSACRSGGKGFFCADLLTGTIHYREKRMDKLSLTCADGLIYGLTQRGEVLLIRPRSDKFDVISRFKIPQDNRALAWAHPVVCGGRLYIRRGDVLYAFDVRAN